MFIHSAHTNMVNKRCFETSVAHVNLLLAGMGLFTDPNEHTCVLNLHLTFGFSLIAHLS